MVEAVDPFEGGKLDCFDVAPGTALTNHLGLVQADGGLGQGIVAGIPDPGPPTTQSQPQPGARCSGSPGTGAMRSLWCTTATSWPTARS